MGKYKIMLVMAILGLFLISIASVSALELNPFANKKTQLITDGSLSNFMKEDFNSNYGVIRISRTIFWISTDKIAEYSLDRNTEQCLITCSAEGKVTIYEDGKLFDDLNFLNKKGGLVDLNGHIYIEIDEEYPVEVPVTREECREVIIDNKTLSTKNICQNIPDGTKTEMQIRKVWREYNGETVSAGDYKWKIEAKKGIKQKVDFIPVAQGRSLDEWAWWDSNWGNKRAITVSDIDGVTHSAGEPVLLVVNASDFAGKIRGDCADMWITNGAETSDVSSKILHCNSSVSEYIYIVFNSTSQINSGGSATYYLYYNNPPSSPPYAYTPLYDKYNFDTDSLYIGAGTSAVTLTTYGEQVGVKEAISDGQMDGVNDPLLSSDNGRVRVDLSIPYRVGKLIATSNSGAGSNGRCPKIYNYQTELLNGSLTYTGENYTESTNGCATDGYMNSTTRYVPPINTSKVLYTGEQVFASDGYTSLNELYIYEAFSSATSLGSEEEVATVSVTLNSPIDDFNTTATSITFNCSVSTVSGTLENVTLWTNTTGTWEINQSLDVVGLANSTTFTIPNLPDQKYLWTCHACSDSGCEYATTNRTFSVHTTPPSVSLLFPVNTSAKRNVVNNYLNFTVTDGLPLSFCWYSLDGGANVSLTSLCNSTSSLSNNVTYFNATNKRHTIVFYANDSVGNVGSSAITFYLYNYSHSADKSVMGEGDTVNLTLYLYGGSISTEFTQTNATLEFNSSNLLPDTTSFINADRITISKSYSVPQNSIGDKYFNWTINIKNTSSVLDSLVTDTQMVEVKNLTITDCNVTAGHTILNLTLKDEEDLTVLNLTSPNTNKIELELQLQSLLNSSILWNFSKTWNDVNTSVAVCVPVELLNGTSYSIDFTIGYDGTDHVREFYFLDNGTLDNTNYFNSYTDNTVDLYDLKTADSTTFLFKFTDEDGLEVQDALIHTFRKYIGEGIFREIERSREDDNGQTHVHLVEEDVIYYFVASQYGTILYTSSTYNAKCLTTPCEISLSLSKTATNWSMFDNEGGKYSVSTDTATRTITTSFNLDTISLVNATVYRFYNGTEEVVNSSSLTATAGTIPLKVPLSYNNATFFVAIYKNNTYVKSEWAGLQEDGSDYFGTFGLILAGILLLCIMLMAVSEGAGFIIFTVLALILVGVMQLVDLGWVSIIAIACAGGIIVWKLINRRNKPN